MLMFSRRRGESVDCSLPPAAESWTATPHEGDADQTSVDLRDTLREVFALDLPPPSAPAADEGVDVRETAPSPSDDDTLPPIPLGPLGTAISPSVDEPPVVRVVAEVDNSDMPGDDHALVDGATTDARDMRSMEEKDWEGPLGDDLFVGLVNENNGVSKRAIVLQYGEDHLLPTLPALLNAKCSLVFAPGLFRG